ncbi:unnamed protein product [Allacma fusca]|uniref:ATP synthase subunit d, mitochondrial n=1 Tax=Allacma fusca TaxID=39272 RepID=A0A8J2JWR0_9HEXA|nr:unnamed protein product [Allacma fusca]
MSKIESTDVCYLIMGDFLLFNWDFGRCFTSYKQPQSAIYIPSEAGGELYSYALHVHVQLTSTFGETFGLVRACKDFWLFRIFSTSTMAARRLAASSINWAAFAERVPEAQRPSFLALKSRTDNYLRRVNANPAEAPKIDWAAYKGKVPIPGLVDAFKKQYEAFQIPYPPDSLSAQIAEQEKQALAETKQFIAESNQRIKDYEAKIAKWGTVLPYEEMTYEEYIDIHPDDSVNWKKPTLWPHDEEEQLGYVEPGVAVEEKKH